MQQTKSEHLPTLNLQGRSHSSEWPKFTICLCQQGAPGYHRAAIRHLSLVQCLQVFVNADSSL